MTDSASVFVSNEVDAGGAETEEDSMGSADAGGAESDEDSIAMAAVSVTGATVSETALGTAEPKSVASFCASASAYRLQTVNAHRTDYMSRDQSAYMKYLCSVVSEKYFFKYTLNAKTNNLQKWDKLNKLFRQYKPHQREGTFSMTQRLLDVDLR